MTRHRTSEQFPGPEDERAASPMISKERSESGIRRSPTLEPNVHHPATTVANARPDAPSSVPSTRTFGSTSARTATSSAVPALKSVTFVAIRTGT